jgi:hypothetical protein
VQTTANGPKGQTEWDTVNWRCANRNVRNLRRRIFRATQERVVRDLLEPDAVKVARPVLRGEHGR